jgi:hypothetical protein
VALERQPTCRVLESRTLGAHAMAKILHMPKKQLSRDSTSSLIIKTAFIIFIGLATMLFFIIYVAFH